MCRLAALPLALYFYSPLHLQAGELPPTFLAKGTLSITAPSARGLGQRITTCAFEVIVKSNAWTIAVEYGPGHSQITGSDGVDTYSLLCDTRNTLVSSIPGFIVPGTYPSHATYHVTVPWYALAFMPGRTFAERINMPAPWRLAATDLWAHTTELDIMLLDARQGSLCREIRFYHSHPRATAASTGPASPATPYRADPQRQPFQHAAINRIADNTLLGHYKVTSTITYKGMTLPQSFSLIYYRASGSSNAPVTNLLFQGEIQRYDVPPTHSCVPVTTSVVDVFDERFRNTHGTTRAIRYRLKDGQWLPRDSLFLASLTAETEQQRNATLFRHLSLRIILLGVLGMILLLPLVYGLCRKHRVNTRLTPERR